MGTCGERGNDGRTSGGRNQHVGVGLVQEAKILNPPYYQSDTDCIQIAEHLPFNLGRSFSLLWRAGKKESDPRNDLNKALWYLNRETLMRTSGRMRSHPIDHQIIELADRAIRQHLPARQQAMRFIVWAASNTDPTDVVMAADHVKDLLEE
jgi:hypothetical protein